MDDFTLIIYVQNNIYVYINMIICILAFEELRRRDPLIIVHIQLDRIIIYDLNELT